MARFLFRHRNELQIWALSRNNINIPSRRRDYLWRFLWDVDCIVERLVIVMFLLRMKYWDISKQKLRWNSELLILTSTPVGSGHSIKIIAKLVLICLWWYHLSPANGAPIWSNKGDYLAIASSLNTEQQVKDRRRLILKTMSQVL